MRCAVCEKVRRQKTLNNAARRAGSPPSFPVCSGRLVEMLMMQCADPNTLPAPSRLHQLERSLSLRFFPSTSFVKPRLSLYFFYESTIVFFFLLLLSFSLSCFSHFPALSSAKPLGPASCFLNFFDCCCAASYTKIINLLCLTPVLEVSKGKKKNSKTKRSLAISAICAKDKKKNKSSEFYVKRKSVAK